MPNDKLLLSFLGNSGDRIPKRLLIAKKMKIGGRFVEVANELETVFPGSKVHFYGTRSMQLGHEKSHLNVFIDIDNSYWMTQSHERVHELQQELMHYFALELQKENGKDQDSSLLRWKKPLTKIVTPVPIVRINLNNPLLQCDITFSSGLGVENTKLIHHMFSLQPEAFKLYHFARLWIHIEEFSFKRYVVGLMVLFYLQNKKLMPSIVQLQEDVGEKFIDGWNVEYNKTKTLQSFEMEPIYRYEDHRIDFFDFYESFDFNNNVICPYLGRAVPLKDFLHGGDPEIAKYQTNIKSFRSAPVNIADSLNLNYNIAYGVGKKRIKKFKQFCEHAIVLLQENQ